MTGKIPYTAPYWEGKAFNCPFCNAYANQSWHILEYYDQGYHRNIDQYGSKICICAHCNKIQIWHEYKLVFPNFSGVEPPNQDLSIEIQNDYQEAALIVQKSSRGAAALLRLAIQKLMVQLGEKGKDLNTDIGNLVKKGLPAKVQPSLDTLRVIGAQAVHPGELDLKDDTETASSLFKLVNFISEKMITEPKEIDDIYNKIPDSKKEQINQRDGK